jgi:hypothetical protein
MSINYIAGILPAIVFPVATLVQLVRMVRKRSAAGVSVPTWLLFGLANVALYIYAERYAEWQTIAGMLVTAVLDFVIVALALFAFRPVEAETPVDSVEAEMPVRRHGGLRRPVRRRWTGMGGN